MSEASSRAMLRIEHKLDLLLTMLLAQDPALREVVVPLGEDVPCPVCNQPVTVRPDPNAEEYVRSCGCVPRARVVAGLKDLFTPREGLTHKKRAPEEPAPEENDDAEGQNLGGGGSTIPAVRRI